MEKVRRTIRRVKTTAEATFDDQLWPINIVLVVMAAFIGGLLLGSERSVMFKSLGLAAVTTIIGALIFGVSTYHGRVARRFQLSSAMSLLLSLCIVVLTGYYDFVPAEFRFKDERKSPPVAQAPKIVVQHFVEQATDQPKDFEKPVETSKAEQETTATAAAKQDVSHPVAARPKTAATSESRVTDPVQLELRRTDAPQSAARSKKVDTQSTKVSTNSPSKVQQVNAPQVATEAPKTPQRPQPKVSSVARRETPSEAKRQVTKADPTAVARPTVTAVPRRQSTPEKVTTPTRPTTQPTKSIAQAQPSNTTPVAAQPTQVATPAKPVAAPAPTATASVPRRTSQTTAEKASAAPSTPQVNQPRPATSNIAKATTQPSSESVRSAPSSTARVQLPTNKPTPQRVEQVAAKAPQTPSQTRPGPQRPSAAVANKSAAGRVTPGRKSAEPQPTRHQGPSAQQLAKAADSAAGGATPVTKAATPTERASAPGAKAIASSAPAPNPATAAVQPTARPTQAQPSTGAVAARSVSAPNSSASRRALEVNASSPTQATVGGAQRAAKSPNVAQPNASHVAKSQPAKSKTAANVSQSRVDFSSTPVTTVASTASPTAQPTQGNANRQVQTDNLTVSKHGTAPLRTSQQLVSTDEMSVASRADPTLRPQLAQRSTPSKTRSQVDRADTTAQQVEQPQLNVITASVPAVTVSPESGSLEQSVSTNAGTNAEKSKQLDGEVSRLAGSASVEAERAAASNPNVVSPQSHAGQSARVAADLADAATQPQAVHAPQVAAVGNSEPKVAGPAGAHQAKTTEVATGDGQPQRSAGDAPAASLASGPSSQPAERATGDAAQPAVDATSVAATARESTNGAKVNVAEVNAPAAAPLNAVASTTSQPTAGGSTGAERSQAQAAATGDKSATATAPTAGAAATAATTASQPAAAGETGTPAATAIAKNDMKATAPSDAVVENVRADVVAPGKIETTGPTVAVNADGKASESDRSVTAASGTPNKATQGVAEGAPQATAEVTALTRATSGTEGPSVEKHEAALAKASGPSGVRDTAVLVEAVAPAASVGPEATAVVRSPVAGASRRKIRATLPVLELPVGEVGGRVANVTQPTFNLSRRKTDTITPAIDSRFIIEKEVGGGSVDARVQAKAFQERGAGKEGDDDFSTHTEDAIEDGLKFLSRWQKDDGRWSLHDNFGEPGGEDEIATSQSDTAATGLALLSYLGAGYDPVNAQRYRQQIRDGLDYLIRNQRTKGKDGTTAADDGDLYVPSNESSDRNARLYSHAIATMALCEAYGMSQDPRYRDAAQRAINFIESSQSKKLGGWRYTPGFEADTSVTGWMITALKSGELAGLKVDKETYKRTKKWLKTASDKGSFGYAYNPLAQDKGETKRLGWRSSSKAMTSVGLLIEMYFGRPKKDSRMVQGAQYLQQRLPEVENGYIDTYYWYYATQVMRHMDGEYWQDWKRSIRPMLLDNQLKQGRLAGSWSPTFSRGVTNRWGDDRWGKNGGRIYVTTLNLLTLEVDYRKLPLYQTDE